MVGRAVLTVVDDSTGLQTVQVEGLRGEVIDGAERMQLYGITSYPLKGADAVLLAVGGVRQHSVVLIDDRRHRPTGLSEGEVCIYSSHGQRIILKANGEIDVMGDKINLISNGDTLTVQ